MIGELNFIVVKAKWIVQPYACRFDADAQCHESLTMVLKKAEVSFTVIEMRFKIQ
jgi:hypothetical protein